MLTELPAKRRVKIPVRVSAEHMKVMRSISQKIKEAKMDVLTGQKANDKVCQTEEKEKKMKMKRKVIYFLS